MSERLRELEQAATGAFTIVNPTKEIRMDWNGKRSRVVEITIDVDRLAAVLTGVHHQSQQTN